MAAEALFLLSQVQSKAAFLDALRDATIADFPSVYCYADALFSWSELAELHPQSLPQNAHEISACPAAATRRGIAVSAGAAHWRSLPAVLEQNQTHWIWDRRGLRRNRQASNRLQIAVSEGPRSGLALYEACELLLAALALDWQAELWLDRASARQLERDLADAHTKAYASLPLFGLERAFLIPDADATWLSINPLLPIEAGSADAWRITREVAWFA